ncbi:MAG: hypothetical protein ACTSUE_19515 [Promethearchaeota archaeon]
MDMDLEYQDKGVDGSEITAIGSLAGEKGEPILVTCAIETSKVVQLGVAEGGTTVSFEELWHRDVGSPIWEIVAIPGGKHGGYPGIFTARQDGNFHAYDLGGVPSWSHHFDATISPFLFYRDPFTGEELLLVPCLDRTLRLLTASGGKMIWGDTFGSGVNCAAQAFNRGANHHCFAAGGNDHTLRLYTRGQDDPVTGYKMAWFHKFESYVRDISIASDGTVAAVADDGFLKIFDAKSGSVRWVREHNSFAWKCKILEEEGIVLSTSYQVPIKSEDGTDTLGNPGIICCTSMDSGDVIWETRPGDGFNVNDWTFGNINGKELVLIGTTGGKIAMLDPKSGKIIHEHETGHSINKVNLLEKDGRVVVIACQENKEKSLVVGLAPG